MPSSFGVKASGGIRSFNDLLSMIQAGANRIGTSSGVNVMGAIKMAKELGPGKTIVTILCDDANKYYEKMFNKNFLNDNNLPIPDWL